MNARGLVIACLAVAIGGCGDSPKGGGTSGHPAPTVGQKVVVAKYEFVYRTPEATRTEPQADYSGDVFPGDLAEVLEVGDEWASVRVVTDHKGNPGKVHGYVKRWW